MTLGTTSRMTITFSGLEGINLEVILAVKRSAICERDVGCCGKGKLWWVLVYEDGRRQVARHEMTQCSRLGRSEVKLWINEGRG